MLSITSPVNKGQHKSGEWRNNITHYKPLIMKKSSISKKSITWNLCAVMLAVAVMFIACSKDKEPEADPGPTPITPTGEDITAKITDAAFRAYCIANFDTDKNGKLSDIEAAVVKEIDVTGPAAAPMSAKAAVQDTLNVAAKAAVGGDIASLAGIEYFTALEKLLAANNHLTTLDVSKNTALIELNLSNNRLADIDVSTNTALTELNIGSNLLETIDISTNTALVKLYVNDNLLVELNIVANTQLAILVAGGNEVLAKISVWEEFPKTDPPVGFDPGNATYVQPGDEDVSEDITSNITDPNFLEYCLQNFDANKDAKISAKEATAVSEISLVEKNITSLDGIEYFTELTRLICRDNQLKMLDVTKNTKLLTLDCRRNQLQTLDVSKNTELTALVCYNNQLQELNVSNNIELTGLWCNNNRLQTLDVSKNMKLIDLWCNNNQLKMLDVSKNAELTTLNCSDNQLQTLDVSKHTELTLLDCRNNQLQVLDISKSTKLRYLNCYNTSSTTIWVWKDFDTASPIASIQDCYYHYSSTFKVKE